MSQFKVGWYLIYTKPHHEKKVYTRLLERNINAFLPLTKRLRSWNDRKKYIDEPLFPSYVFIYLNDMLRMQSGYRKLLAAHLPRTGGRKAFQKTKHRRRSQYALRAPMPVI